MTRLTCGVIILVVAALVIAVPAGGVFAQGNPKETGAGGGGGQRDTPTPGVSTAGSGSGGPTGASMPAGGMGPSSGGSSGGSWGGSSGGGSYNGSADSGGSTYGDTRRTASPRDRLAGTVPTTEASPWFSRTRGNNLATGTATVRTTPVGGTGTPGSGGPTGGNWTWPGYGYYPGYYGYYGPYGYYGWAGWGGYGLYSYYYDPFWSGYGGYGYGGYPGYGYGYGSDYGGGSGWSTPSGYAPQQRLTGSIKLKVKPAFATVYVDGYYSGRVEDFDGLFQKLRLEPGPHTIEISAQGFKSISFEVNVRAGESINFQGALEIIK